MAAAAAPLLQSPSLIQLPLQFQIHLPPSSSSSSSLSLLSPAAKLVSHPSIFRSPRPRRPNCKRFVPCSHANASIQAQGSFDPDLRSVLELATDSELYELERILFGPSYFSPLLKSITTQADVDYFMIEEDLDERDAFIATLESRFFFLAADARSTIRGWRPSYRNVLLGVRAKLNIPCSRKLSTEDLEAEIFLHLLQEYSSDESGTLPSSWESSKLANSHGSLEVGLSHWKVQAASALRVGAAELRAVILKGGGMLTLGKLYNLLVRKLTGRMFMEAANYQIRNDVIKKGGQFAAVALESRVALLKAKQGVAGAAARYMGLRSMMSFLGPILKHLFRRRKRRRVTSRIRKRCFHLTLWSRCSWYLLQLKGGFGEYFLQMLSFKCLELIMLESCEPFMHLHRSGSPAHTSHRLTSAKEISLSNVFVKTFELHLILELLQVLRYFTNASKFK